MTFQNAVELTLILKRTCHMLLSFYQVLHQTQKNWQKPSQLLRRQSSILDNQQRSNEPDNLEDKSLAIALPYLAEYIQKKYHVSVKIKTEILEERFSYELRADIYKIIYEALTSAIANGDGNKFAVQLQTFKDKIWLTISDDKNSFIHYKNSITFDMAMYLIRQIGKKHQATINTFDEEEKGSQLVINIPLENP